MTVAFFRLLLWVVVLSAAVYTCLHVFSADDKGLFHYRARINIEENGMSSCFLLMKGLMAYNWESQSLDPLWGLFVLRINRSL